MILVIMSILQAKSSAVIELNKHVVTHNGQDGSSDSTDKARPVTREDCRRKEEHKYIGKNAIHIQRCYLEFICDTETSEKIKSRLNTSEDIAFRCSYMSGNKTVTNAAYDKLLEDSIDHNAISLTILHVLEEDSIVSPTNHWNEHELVYSYMYCKRILDAHDVCDWSIIYTKWADKDTDTVLPSTYQKSDKEFSYNYMLQSILDAINGRYMY